METPTVKTFVLEPPMWMPHLPGQHYDVRLTAPDGYVAQRSYSIASSPLDEGRVELTIDCLADGEVSPYFHDVVQEGDQVEVRGPFASYFVWRGEAPGAADRRRLGRGAADGHAAPPPPRDARRADAARVLRAQRRGRDLRLRGAGRHRAHLLAVRARGLDRPHRPDRRRPDRRPGLGDAGLAFICGSNPFVEAASMLLLDLGVHASRIRTERFGPTS